jgi:hypothetical protein
MITRAHVQAFFQSPPVRLALFLVGVLLIVVTPLVAIFPGPGGIITFGAGMALALKNSEWAKRKYVHFKRWQPRAGRWADWGLRRRSAKRREALAKQRAAVMEEPLRR